MSMAELEHVSEGLGLHVRAPAEPAEPGGRREDGASA